MRPKAPSRVFAADRREDMRRSASTDRDASYARADKRCGGLKTTREAATERSQKKVSSLRENQRQFLSKRLVDFRNMNHALIFDCLMRPSLQYLLATLCDLKVEPEHRQRLGTRYPFSPEVRKLLGRLADEKPVSASTYAPNAILSALKEILGNFPGGIFVEVSEEFYQISISSPLEITVVYLNGLICTLPFFLRQFVYLISAALRNVVTQSSGSPVDAYTDLLLMFTPVLFPTSVGDMQRFLRAARLTLVMVDCSEQVFQPSVWLDQNGNVWQPLNDEESSLYRSVIEILASIQRLEASLEDSDEEEGSTQSREESSESPLMQRLNSATHTFYQFAYLDSL